MQFCPIVKVGPCHHDLKAVHSSRIMRQCSKREYIMCQTKEVCLMAFQGCLFGHVIYLGDNTIDPNNVASKE